MRSSSPSHTWRVLILFGVTLTATLGGITAARKRAAPPAPDPTPASQPAPAPAPKPATPKPAAAKPAAPAPAPAPMPAAKPAPQQPSAASQLSPDEQSAAVQRRADLVRERAKWFHDQRAYPFQNIPAGALQRAIEQRDGMRTAQSAGKQSLAPAGIISFPGDGVWHLTGPQPTNVQFGDFPGGGNFGFPTASGRVTALAADATDTTGNTIYLGTAAGGVWKTIDGGAHWTPLTDNQPSLAVGSITIDPNNHNTIYVGTGEENFSGDEFYGAGILKSTDAGATWKQMGASTFAQVLGPQTGGAMIGGIAVQPGNSNVVLASVSFFVGGTVGGVYRSTDAGFTWTEVSGANAPIGFAATGIVFDPASVASPTGATVYAAMGNLFGETANGIYKSADSGVTWSKLTTGLPASGSNIGMGRITLALAPSTSGNTAVLYAAIADASVNSNDLLGFFKTTDAGATWTKLTNTPPFCNHICWYANTVGVNPANSGFVVVGGGAYTNDSTSLFKSADGGITWTNSTPGTDFTLGSTNVRPHVDTHAFAFAANGANPPRFYVGNDGGIWRTDDPGPTPPLWVDLNATLALSQFYPGAQPSISDENWGFGGTQDNDVQVFEGTLDWTGAPACGDGGYTAIDKNTPTTIYAGCNSTAAAKVVKSIFYGLSTPVPPSPSLPSFQRAETEITASGDTMGFIPPLVIDPNISSNLYFGTCRIWQTTNSATTWTAATGDLTQANAPAVPAGGCADLDEITAIDVSKQAFGMLLAGTSNGKVWQISFGFPSEIDNGLLPNRNITAVRSKPGDSTGDIGYVTLSGFGSCPTCGNTPGHVFKTKNATQGPSATWTDISGNLPDVPVNDIIVDHSDNPTFDAVYIATDVGVFSCPDPEAATPCTNWTVLGDGLPNSPVLSLSMRPESRILHAATHGRSMWDLQLTDEPSTALPLIGSLTPAAVMAGSATINVTVTGVNFGPNTKVALGSGRFAFIPAGMNTTFVSTTQLTVSVPATLMVSGAVQSVGLIDPLGVEGNTLPFAIMNPIPVVTGVTFSPNPGVVAEPVTVTVTGSGFLSGATNLNFNGIEVFGIVSNGGAKFVATVDGSDLTQALAGKSVPVSVLNSLPGGGPAVGSAIPIPNFPVSANTTPEIQFSPGFASFNPGQDAGTTSVVLNVKLTNNGGATLSLNGASATKGGINPGDFTLVPPDSGQPNFGAPTCGFITGGGGTSIATGATCFFGITFSPPALTPPGSRSAALTVSDNDADTEPTLGIAGEVNGPIPEFFLALPLANSCSVTGCFPTPVNFGAVPKGTAIENDGTLFNGGSGTTPLSVATIGILSSANSGDFTLGPPSAGSITLACSPLTGGFNLPSGGLGSCSLGLTFTPTQAGVQENATLEFTFSNPGIGKIDVPLTGIGVVPTIDLISPQIVQTGGPAFTLNVTGKNYVLGSVVNFNGSARLTTFVSATQLQASIPASDLTTAGSDAITVTNPAGGGTSEPKTLFVAQAETASNDDINFATNAGSTPFRATQDTTQATAQLTASSIAPAEPADPAPACTPGTATQAGKARSVWFLFKAPANGRVIADTRFSSYTTILSAWTLSGALPSSTVTFTPVTGGCATGNVPGATPASLIGFNVTSGTNYYVMVTDASAGGLGGTLTLSLDFQSTTPPNDDNLTPTVISSAPFSGTVNTIQATANTNGHADPALPGGCAAGAASNGQANSVWYSFTAPGTGTITADTLTSPYDTILNVTSGTPTGAQIACNDNAGAGIAQSLVTFAATSGTKYFFMVSSFLGDGGTTNFHLSFKAGPPPTLTSIAVTPANPSVAAGKTQQFTATGTFSDSSTQDLTGTVTWASGTTSVATIAAGGLATTLKVGASTISATSGSVVGSTTLTVTAAALVSIAVTPVNPSVAAGNKQQFTATGTFSDSTTQNLTGSVTWASGTTTVATIAAGGLATTLKVGTSTISATSGSVVGSTTLTVTAAVLVSIAVTPANPSVAAGKTQQFTATGTFSDSSTQDLTGTVTWASGTTSVATIDAGGLATDAEGGHVDD